MKNQTALITGASSGIGMELAKIHASEGGHLVLVARGEDVLNTLKTELESSYGVNVTVLAEDLSVPGAARRVFDRAQQAGVEVDILINNAGFGGHGQFYQRNLEAEHSMMQVNMIALTELTHLFVQPMVKKQRGKILNVSSTASFIPGPLQAVYYATKAFVTSFSQALAEELKDLNISVTALCPGAVKTGFAKAGDLEGVEIFKRGKSAQSVAQCGYDAMQKGELLAFNEGGLKFLLNWVIPFLPRRVILSMSRQSMEKTI